MSLSKSCGCTMVLLVLLAGAAAHCETNDEWDLLHCANLAANSNDPFLRLDARFGVWPQDKFCQAIKTDLIKQGDYTISVEMWNEQSSCGQNCGHLGLIFNVWDPYNYDFVYVRFHSAVNRIQTGTVINGHLTFIGLMSDNSAITGPAWNTLKLVVTRASKSASVYLNTRKLGDFNFTNTARGQGGVLIANGYENIGKFQSFTIL